MRTSSWKPNYGDMLVCAALLRQVELDDTVRVGFPRTLEQPVSRALIRGSTYLHNRFDFEGASQTLDSIDAPLTIVGLGAQNFESDVSFLGPGCRRPGLHCPHFRAVELDFGARRIYRRRRRAA